MKRPVFIAILSFLALSIAVLSALPGRSAATSIPTNPDLVSIMPDHLPKATFAGGCFWCLESEFRNKPGVVYTRVGYSGGNVENPTYEMISTGRTGHAEAIEIYYDPEKTDYTALLDHFLRNAHDPTTLNQQWVDKGTQYRSAIFYHDEDQRKQAQAMIEKIDAEKVHKARIVTELTPAVTFWVAEEYHQQYYEAYEREKGQPHIRVVLKDELKKKKE